ncbi:MAG: hypothetical protein JO292_00930 [Betaproteobacteria bacterium]|nr:hypothetical protein [Betaproteobacteria bacterium]MBV9359928.1 hypothetical protein [Betaproteobacteria bacterium]
MRFLLSLAAIACAALLAGCYGHGEPADPPVGGITATPGDQLVTLTWVPDSGVEYWLYFGPGTTVDVLHPVSIKLNVQPPYVIGGLTNGTTYAFTITGRKDGGPGGSPAPVATAIPRPDGYEWKIGGGAGTNDLKGVAYGTAYDIVGNAGTLFQSTDGITWTQAAGNWAAMAGVTNVNDIIFTAAGYIAVGDAGLILFSADNTNWTAGAYAVPPAPAQNLNALATNGSRVVAVGNGGAIYYSDNNAATWTAATVPAGTGNLYGVAWASTGQWVAVGAAGTILNSTDGSNWVAATSVTPAITTDLRSATSLVSTGIYTAVGLGGQVATSTNGVNWTTESITTNDLLAVAGSVAGTGLFVAVGQAGVAFTSFDGVTWTARTTGSASNLFAVVNGGGQFVVGGQAGTTLYSR